VRSLELWGGVECTVNRVGDAFSDQVRRSGHHDRAGDIGLIASTGIRTLRYPLLWERIAPDGLDSADWAWTDDRLGRLRRLGIRPIAGLIHHGSGPRSTNLLDPAFPHRFAEYARAVAERYPWIDDYTPVNEPLTTARFSGLYGHWYPHRRDDASLVIALMHQILATVLAMQAIRTVNPRARLVQTEDAGRTYSTPRLAYQASFENHRRWLTVDLLTGRVSQQHPLWPWLVARGADPDALNALTEQSCPPDVVGLNYYFTSDRFLDDRVERYSADALGGNGRDIYADVDAVRARGAGCAGHRRILVEAWERYRLPVAVTEVHAGCTREEQMRWLVDAWTGAERARRDGADVRAVTLWALFGSVDWDSLVVRCNGTYEPGAFDVRSDPPRPTAVAGVARALTDGTPVAPLALENGWWRRAGGSRRASAPVSHRSPRRARRPLLIVGARGTLGSAIARACVVRGLDAVPLGRADLDITDRGAVADSISRHRPWAVVNAAGYVQVDEAEREPGHCLRLNSDAPADLAAACATAGARFVTFSSDLVFDGQTGCPYAEGDLPAPLGVYGMSKAEAELRVGAAFPGALIVRTSAFFGPADEHNFLTVALRTLSEGHPFPAAEDCVVSPTYVPDLADAVLDLLIDGERGLWHLANRGEVSWAAFARAGAAATGLDASLVIPTPIRLLGLRAPRPAYSALGSTRGLLLPSIETAIARYTRDTAGFRADFPSRDAYDAGRPADESAARWTRV
jgi:dTDP-4-dehydrorhamnose reductase